MKIIDAHFHLFGGADQSDPRIAEMLAEVGHRPGMNALEESYRENDFVHGIVMSNNSLDPADHVYPEQFHYCIGIDKLFFGTMERTMKECVPYVEENLKREQCCGIKLYPGYLPLNLGDPMCDAVYELAEKYGKPVAVHMGQTAMPGAQLKYAHPLNLDEAAVRFPNVRFVMCHFGNPFLPDAAAVVEKNPNVAADLSGLLEGITDLDEYFEEQSAYIAMLRGWLAYVNRWDSLMFGTDYPAVNLGNYAEFIRRLIPEKHHEDVFFNNANRIYQLGL